MRINGEQGRCITCHPLCDFTKGCVGPGANACVQDACQGFVFSVTSTTQTDPAPAQTSTPAPEPVLQCVDECPTNTHTQGRICHACHGQCLDQCGGAGPANCKAGATAPLATGTVTSAAYGCRNAALSLADDQAMCVSVCPNTHFQTPGGMCRQCSPLCSAHGCRGASNVCASSTKQPECTRRQFYNPLWRRCAACHDLCAATPGAKKMCHGPQANQCENCVGKRQNGTCVPDCHTLVGSNKAFLDLGSPGYPHCRKCHPECIGGCSGPTAASCSKCRHYQSISGACLSDCSVGFAVTKLFPDVPDAILSNKDYTAPTCYPCTALPSVKKPPAFDCTVCGMVALVNGTCVPTCPAHQTAVNHRCQCPPQG